MPALVGPRCSICGDATTGSRVCGECRASPPPVDHVHSLYRHDGLARLAVHALKFRGHRHLAGLLGSHLVALVDVPPDLVVPVPLHPARERERGFNQSELLGWQIASRLNAPEARALRRTRPTPPQTSIHPDERASNVRGAFAIADRAVAGQRILLVDDVCTTGATLYECARVLRRAGASTVSAITVTRALRPV